MGLVVRVCLYWGRCVRPRGGKFNLNCVYIYRGRTYTNNGMDTTLLQIETKRVRIIVCVCVFIYVFMFE